jgi:hypothetical protein
MRDNVLSIDVQCWRHVLKRLVNFLRQVQRVLQIGEHIITIDGCWQLLEDPDTRLRLADINRDDRQSVDSAQRVVMHRVVNLFDPSSESNYCGLRWYLELVGHFVDVFISNHHTAKERVFKASLVYHSLLIWRHSIKKHGSNLSLTRNFITNVTMVDACIALHCMVW